MRYLKYKSATLAGFFSLLVLLGACRNSNDDNSNPGNVTPAAGQWKVSYFFDKQDETGNYAAYVFEFDTDGSMSASNGSQTWAGSWAAGIDDSNDKFLINFTDAVPSALEELEEDWRIIDMQDNFMHFEHTSGGNGDTDILKFTRN